MARKFAALLTAKTQIAIALVALGISMESPASAQEASADAGRGVPVYARPRPELDPLGIRAGAFMIHPEARLTGTFNDNVYATKNNRKSDFVTTVAPSVSIASNWSRHSLGLDAGVTAGFYADRSDEDYVDGRLGLNGRLDVLRETFIEGHLGVARRHEERGDPDVPLANKKPSIYYQYNAGVTGYHGAGRLSLRMGTDFTRNDYHSVDIEGGGERSQTERDYNVYEPHVRVAYELLPNVIPFIQGRYNWRRYDNNSVHSDSEGYRIALGTGFDAGGIITGEVYGGYMRQSYDESDRKDAKGLWFGGNVLWNVTRLTSVQAGLERRVNETQRTDSSGYTRTAFQSRVDHELLRNLLIGAYGDVWYDDYNGVNIDDTYYEAGPRITYLWNRNLTAELSASHRRRDSNRDSRNYKTNRVLFSITGRL